VRRRAAERGPLFDGMPGLALKLFLVDPVDPCYATFYLWREPEAALAFLGGAFFAALVETFGRPEVRLLLPTRIVFPPPEARQAVLGGDSPAASLRCLDPRTGAGLALDFGVAAEVRSGRRFEIMYRAEPRGRGE
jgi:hypothetical protein